MKSSMLTWDSLIMGFIIVGSFGACNGNQGREAEDEKAPVDVIAEPLPTPVEKIGEGNTEEAAAAEVLLQEYMDVKNALVADNFEAVKEEAKSLLQQFDAEAGDLGNRRREKIRNSIQQLVNATDIQAQRQAFAVLSDMVYKIAKRKDLTNNTLYWKHCPMAMNNQGASWLSFEKDIQNPYMGQSMPKCGSVKEVINK